MDIMIATINAQIAEIDECIVECNCNFHKLMDSLDGVNSDIRKRIIRNLEEYAYLTQKQRALACKREQLLCDAFFG